MPPPTTHPPIDGFPEDLIVEEPEVRRVPVKAHSRRVPVYPQGADLDTTAHARRSDPPTSAVTAEEITRSGALKGYQVFVLRVFQDRFATRGRDAALIDYDLYRVCEERGFRYTEQGLRTARCALVRKGLLEPTGDTRKTPCGHSAVEYRLTEKGETFETAPYVDTRTD